MITGLFKKLLRAGMVFGIAAGISVALLCTVEMALRYSGWGEDRSPFIRREAQGKVWHVRNFNFYRQFSGTQPRDNFFFAVPDRKAPDTCRIFVFGSSAAADWPTVGTGFSSILWLMLAERYPGVQFEVYNCADAGVNSHIMRTMAKACEKFKPDVFLVYTGNNELNGPFGITTAMRSGAVPSAGMAQRLIALRGLRLTQLREAYTTRPGNPYGSQSGFPYAHLALRRLPGTPEIDRIVQNYRENLTAICRSASRSGARTVLCTLAVNLRDWAPEDPAHLVSLSPEETERWDRLFEEGISLAEQGRWEDALQRYDQARAIDDTHAGLWWRTAQCLLRLNRKDEARQAFQAARDRDSARWSATRSFLNETVREVARRERSGGVLLADVEKSLAERSEDGITGGQFIPDSCHFSFRGHWEAARAILPALESALPETVRQKRAEPESAVSEDDMALLLHNEPSLMLTFLRGLQGVVQTAENRQYLQRQIDQYEQYARQPNDPLKRLSALESYREKVKRCPCRAAFELDALSSFPPRDHVASGRELLAQCPQYAVAYVGFLERLRTDQQWESLWEISRSALTMFPEAPSFWVRHIQAAKHLGNTDEVAKKLTAWLKRFPWSADLWYCHGDLEFERRRTQTAVDAWFTALLISPPQCQALGRLSELSPAEITVDPDRLPRRVIRTDMLPFFLACLDYLNSIPHASGNGDSSTAGGHASPKASAILNALANSPLNAPAYWRDQLLAAAAGLENEDRPAPAKALRQLAELLHTASGTRTP
ncbi:MAG TPA: tetratricopeptide repeat protein [Candidatus Hydrogenedentes bacterium]|nr:tetratricopeptide repeat protein [Candidatus Hydrogenedentota bacterium]